MQGGLGPGRGVVSIASAQSHGYSLAHARATGNVVQLGAQEEEETRCELRAGLHHI